MEGKEIALIFSGGSTKCFYGAGFLYGLVQNRGLVDPSLIVDCSGSIVKGPFYLTGQYSKCRQILEEDIAGKYSFSGLVTKLRGDQVEFLKILKSFTGLFTNRDVISPKRVWRMIDVGKVIEIIHREGLFDEENLNKIFASPVNYIIPAIEFETGKINYFSNRDEYLLRNKKEFARVMLAGMNLPVASEFPFWKPTEINRKHYFDTIMTSNWKTHLGYVLKLNNEKFLGLKKILAIDHNACKCSSDRVFDMWFGFQPKEFKQMYREKERKIEDSYKENLAFLRDKGISLKVVKPKKLEITTLDDNKDALIEVFDRGFKRSCDSEFDRFFRDY